VIDEAVGGNLRPDPLVDWLNDLDHALPLSEVCLHVVTRPYRRCRLGGATIDLDVAASARRRRDRSRLAQPYGPQPLVDADGVD